MWIESTKNGKYKAVERYTDPLTGKQKRITITIDKNTTSSRKLAERALHEKISAAITSRDYSDITLLELSNKWIEYQEQEVKLSTLSRNQRISKTLCKILGGDTIVSKLNARYVMEQLKKDTKNGPGTINERITRLKAMIRWGYKADYIKDISWLDKLDPMKDEEKKEKLSMKFMESSELKLLLSEMKVEKWKDMTRFLALTGLRPGEAFALRSEDIDIGKMQIHVTRTLDCVNNIFTTTKTDSSTRDVSITNELLPLCKKLLQKAKEKHFVDSDQMIFYVDKNSYSSYGKYMRENTEAILGRRLTPHALRHTYVALLAENGIPLDVISRRLGHKDSSVTRDVYFHVTKKLKEKEDKMLQNVTLL